MAGGRSLVHEGTLSDPLIDGDIITKEFEHDNPDSTPCPAEAPSAIHSEALITGMTKTPASQPSIAGFDGFIKQIDIFLSTPAPDEQTMKQMAGLFMKTCPGDWELPWNYGFRHDLRTVRDGTGEPANSNHDNAAIMKFRLEAARLADAIVEVAHLKQPAGEICIMWDFRKWWEDAEKRFSSFDTRKNSINNTLRNAGVFAKPLLAQGPPSSFYPFYRFSDYITASILEMDPSEEEALEKCQAVIEVFNKRLEVFGQGVL